jgi:hypothetical protein
MAILVHQAPGPPWKATGVRMAPAIGAPKTVPSRWLEPGHGEAHPQGRLHLPAGVST